MRRVHEQEGRAAVFSIGPTSRPARTSHGRARHLQGPGGRRGLRASGRTAWISGRTVRGTAAKPDGGLRFYRRRRRAATSPSTRRPGLRGSHPALYHVRGRLATLPLQKGMASASWWCRNGSTICRRRRRSSSPITGQHGEGPVLLRHAVLMPAAMLIGSAVEAVMGAILGDPDTVRDAMRRGQLRVRARPLKYGPTTSRSRTSTSRTWSRKATSFRLGTRRHLVQGLPGLTYTECG